jgi:hypothetical protein
VTHIAGIHPAFDPAIPPCLEAAIGPDNVIMEHWKEFYPEALDEKPPNMPELRGTNPVVIATYVNANHAGNLANRRSYTGILIYVNNALIHWYSMQAPKYGVVLILWIRVCGTKDSH